jgi:hypothetical protein
MYKCNYCPKQYKYRQHKSRHQLNCFCKYSTMSDDDEDEGKSGLTEEFNKSGLAEEFNKSGGSINTPNNSRELRSTLNKFGTKSSSAPSPFLDQYGNGAQDVSSSISKRLTPFNGGSSMLSPKKGKADLSAQYNEQLSGIYEFINKLYNNSLIICFYFILNRSEVYKNEYHLPRHTVRTLL